MAAGEQSFKRLLACHAVGEDAKNKVGPLLNGLEGRKSGTIEGFTYTNANKNSGIVWNEETFNNYIRAQNRSRAPRWSSPASRTKRTSPIFGPISPVRADGKK